MTSYEWQTQTQHNLNWFFQLACHSQKIERDKKCQNVIYFIKKQLQCYDFNLIHLFHNMQSEYLDIYRTDIWGTNEKVYSIFKIKYLIYNDLLMHLLKHKMDDSARSSFCIISALYIIPDNFVKYQVLC